VRRAALFGKINCHRSSRCGLLDGCPRRKEFRLFCAVVHAGHADRFRTQCGLLLRASRVERTYKYAIWPSLFRDTAVPSLCPRHAPTSKSLSLPKVISVPRAVDFRVWSAGAARVLCMRSFSAPAPAKVFQSRRRRTTTSYPHTLNGQNVVRLGGNPLELPVPTLAGGLPSLAQLRVRGCRDFRRDDECSYLDSGHEFAVRLPHGLGKCVIST